MKLAPDFISKIRIGIIAFLVFSFYAVLVFKLWQVQVLQGEDTKEKVSRQYIRKIRIPAVRGRILTSDGVALADNRPSMNVVFHISEMRQPGSISKTVDFIFRNVKKAAETVGRKTFPSKEDITHHIARTPGLPLTAFEDLSKEETAKAFEASSTIPGMELVCDAVRIYPHGSLAGNLVGYVRRDDPGNADDRRNYSYYVPDIVGKSGLELAFDKFPEDGSGNAGEEPGLPSGGRLLLRGTPGKKLIVVDNRRFIRETAGPEIPAENGKSIVLTINFRAQKIAEELLRGLSAAMVVMDADSGEIVAMASAPSYSPGDFIPFISKENYKMLLEAPDKPLFNKAIQGAYSPGSIVKPLMGLAILHNGADPEETMVCDGFTPIGNYELNCWIRPLTGSGHGRLDLTRAIVFSCNDFFVTNGLKLGVDKISKTFASAGFGRKTGISLPETGGRLPSRKLKKNWTAFDTALVSIGQGQILVSPLQAAVYISAIANGGTIYRPRIIRSVIDSNDNTVFSSEPEVRGKLLAEPGHLDLIRNAMHLAVYEQNGTAKNAKNDAMELCGKTGTAEIGTRERHYKNGWFAGFGTSPDTGKTYAIVVFVEHAISGGRSAAPLAARFFELWTPE